MKNILLENMLRFGTKNLSKEAHIALEKLTEQAPATPVAVNLPNLGTVQVNQLEVLFDKTTQEYTADVTYTPTIVTGKQTYTVSGVTFTTKDGKTNTFLKFTTPFVFNVPLNGQSADIAQLWSESVQKIIDTNLASKVLLQYGQVLGGKTTGANTTTQSNPVLVQSFQYDLGNKMWESIKPTLIKNKLYTV